MERHGDLSVMDTVRAGGWQIVQERERLRVLVVGLQDGPAGEELAGRLRAALADAGAVPPPLAVEGVVAIPRGPGGKTPLVNALPGI